MKLMMKYFKKSSRNLDHKKYIEIDTSVASGWYVDSKYNKKYKTTTVKYKISKKV